MARSDQTSDRSSARHLVYAVSALCVAGLAFNVLRILLPGLRIAVPLLVGWWFWRRYRNGQKSQQATLNALFYQLIQEHQGRVTVLDFAMATKLSAIAAREFLDARAKEFSAHFEVTEQGDMFYVFRTLKSHSFQPLVRNQPPPASADADEKSIAAVEPLTQAQLARRLRVSADTIRRKKFSSNLAAWTKNRDPDEISWTYLEPQRRFWPSILLEKMERDRPLQQSSEE